MTIKSEEPVGQPCLVLRLWNLWFWNWARQNGSALQAIFYHLPRYLWGDWKVHRQHLKRTAPTVLFCRRQWVGIEKWRAPSLHAAVMDGMGEHYGYPRHHAYLLLWWNRRGYAFGVEYSCPQNAHVLPLAAKDQANE